MNKPNLIPTKFDAIFKMVGGSISGTSDGTDMKYNSGQTPPSEEAIESKFKELTAEYEAQTYARKRKAEYDALNQFELISDDANNGTTTHIDAVNAIKTKYPKP